MSIILRFFANGEFSQGVDTSQRRDKRTYTKKHQIPTPLNQECRDGYMQWVDTGDNADIHLCVPGTQFRTKDGGVYTYLCEDTDGHHYAYEGKRYVLPDVLMNEPIGRMIARGELVPLVYQSVESSPQPVESRKRLDSMTKNMARNIRNAVFLLEEKYGKDQLSFLTLTLPDLSTDELKLCCENWDKMTDQLLKAMRKRLQKYTMDFEYVYCTEIQSKRLQQRREYAPHIHIVFRGRNGRKAGWCFTPKQIRSIWSGIIAHTIGRHDFRRDALENLQRVKYSAARYLSKYLSKGACSLPSEVSESPIRQLRTQWGGMARIQSTAVRKSTTRLSSIYTHGGLGLHFLRRMDELLKNGIVKYYKEGFIPISICPTTGMERGLKVGCGCLAIPTIKGGLVAVAKYLFGI